MKYFKEICLIVFLLFLGKVGTAQQINTAKLDSLFNILSSNNLMMGGVAISKGDKIVYKKSFGYRYIDSSRKIPADENTKYRIGSITKLFTSVMIFQLVQEHRLTLDTKLSKFYPQIKNADKITIADMMHHRSGIHDASNDAIYQPKLFKAKTEADVLSILASCPSDFEPDTKSSYSNSNFTLLGYIIERLDKDDYAMSLKKRITNKLHLKNTYIGGDIKELDNEAFPYFFQQVKWFNFPQVVKMISENQTVVGGAGFIISTPTDLNIFLNALFDGNLINKESLAKDTTIKGDFGMDIYKFPFDKEFGWGHNGKVAGYYADLYKFLHADITVAICYNGVNYSTNDILFAILSCCFDKPFSFSTFDKPTIINVDTVIFQKYVGTYTANGVPLKIKVFVKDGKLYAQATGQSAFPLSAVSEKEFVFEKAGIDMLFDENNEFTIKQAGTNYLFKKEN